MHLKNHQYYLPAKMDSCSARLSLGLTAKRQACSYSVGWMRTKHPRVLRAHSVADQRWNTQVYMELLGEYYNTRYGVDFRSLRLPGVISADTIPGGGTTDYAVDIYRHAIQHPKTPFSCYLRPDSALPMMMIGDCVNGIVSCMEANDADLTQRVYNLGACSFTPEMVTASIQKRIPSFQIEYNVDERQRIADSWPNSLDDSRAREDWGWAHTMDLDDITDHMLDRLQETLSPKH
eukprot:m.1379529 g.1379529  ORF g.1379529 m.1379529 type:complete len:234 (+) comp24965_c1_seq13:177-878(+)